MDGTREVRPKNSQELPQQLLIVVDSVKQFGLIPNRFGKVFFFFLHRFISRIDYLICKPLNFSGQRAR
jgi:hypothetical protein